MAIIPLVVGSLMVSLVALCLAVPFGGGRGDLRQPDRHVRRAETSSSPTSSLFRPFPRSCSVFSASRSSARRCARFAGRRGFPGCPAFPYSERLNISHRGVSARPHRGADDLHAGGGCAATTCRALSRRRPSPSARRGCKRSCASRARLALRHHLGGVARARPGHRRDHGRAAVRG